MIIKDYNIGRLTTFQVESFASSFFDIKSEDDFLEFLDNFSNLKDKKCFIFGGGSNLLFKEDFYENIFFIRFLKRGIKRLDNKIFEVSAGENLNFLINYLNKINIKVLNPLFGLPGTVGGAVVGNAGSFGSEMGDFVEEVEIFDLEKGKIIKLSREYLDFSYRKSNLKNEKILLVSVILNFNKKIDNDLKDKMRYLNRRLEHQPHGNTCGSYFKNIFVKNLDEQLIDRIKGKLNNVEDIKVFDNFIEKGIIPAGWIIDKAGLKGYDAGGVKVSQKHANFIINYSNKSGKKIYKLGNIIKEKVFDKFGIKLEEEVVII